MSSVDDRIVNMQFNNKQFLKGAAQSEASLNQLESALHKVGKNKGLETLGQSAETVRTRFSAMQVIGVTALANLTNSAIGFGKSMVGKVLGPLKDGGLNRALSLEKARFQFKGLKMDVEESMKSALDAVRGTAYGLDEAASLAGQFGASGMSAGAEMTEALRGVAGAAAMTGSSFTEIGQIFKSIAGEGKVSTVRMEQFGTRGLNAWAKISEQMKISEVELREMVKQGKLSFQEFAGAMSDAFGKHATKASETYEGALSLVNSALGRIGASFSETKLESHRQMFNALAPVIDRVHSTLEPLIKAYANWQRMTSKKVVGFLEQFHVTDKDGAQISAPFENLMAVFNELRKIAFNVRHILVSVGSAVVDAFKEVFGGSSMLKQVEGFAKAIRLVLRTIRLGLADSDALKNIFVSIFTVVKAGLSIIGAVASAFGRLFSAITGNKDVFSGLLSGLGALLQLPVAIIQVFADAIVRLLGSFSSDKVDSFDKSLGRVHSRFEPITNAVRALQRAFSKMLPSFGGVQSGFNSLSKGIGDVTKNLGRGLVNALKSGDFKPILDLINTGLLGGIVLLVKRFFNDSSFSLDLSGGLLGAMSGSFEALTGNLEAMQSNIKAGTLLKIAAAVALLTASIIALSLIDSAALTKSLTAISVAMAQLLGAMAILVKISGHAGFVKIPIIAFSMNLLASSVLVLSFAVRSLSSLSWNELAKGLTGVAGILLAVSLAVGPLSKNSAGMIRASLGMIAIGVALNIIAQAVKSFAELNWKDLGKGLAGVAGALVAIAGGMQLMPSNMLANGLALIAIGFALKEISKAVAQFAELNWKDLGKGLAGVAGALVAIAGGMRLMPKGIVLQAAGLLIIAEALKALSNSVASMAKLSWKNMGKGLAGMAGALLGIAVSMRLMPKNMLPMSVGLLLVSKAMASLTGTLKTMAGMSWGEIGKGLAVLAGSLLILAGGMAVMTGSIAGAAALLIVVSSLQILVPVLQTLGEMSWGEIGKGLATLAAMFLLIGAAGLLLTPVIVPLLGLGAAMVLLGAGLALAGAGMLAFGAGFALMASAGLAGTAVLTSAFQDFMKMLPQLAVQMGKAFVTFLQEIAKNAPKIRKAFSDILSNLLGIVRDAIPEFGKLFRAFIEEGIKNVRELAPKFWALGTDLIIGFLEHLNSEIPKIAESAITLIETFLQEITDKSIRLVDAGFEMIIQILEGLDQSIQNNGERLRTAGRNLAKTIFEEFKKTATSLFKSFVPPMPKMPKFKLPFGGGGGGGKNAERSAADVSPRGAIDDPIDAVMGDGFASNFRGAWTNLASDVTDNLRKAFAKGANSRIDAVRHMSNVILAGNDRGQVFNLQKKASNLQKKSDRLMGESVFHQKIANAQQKAANKAQRAANQAKGKAKTKKLQRKADKLQAAADLRQQKAEKRADKADKIQEQADRAAEKAARTKQFNALKSSKNYEDIYSAGIMRDEDAVELAAKAAKRMEAANAKEAKARKLAQTKLEKANKAASAAAKKQAKALLKQAKKDAKEAAKLAKAAQKAHNEAVALYAKAVTDRIKAIRDQQAQEKADREWQEKFDAADTSTKQKMLEDRAAANEAKAKAAEKAANDALIEANRLKSSNPEKAMELLDRAEAQFALSNQLADSAKQDRDQAKQLKEQAEQELRGGGAGGTGGSLMPSKSVLEDAANAVDRYTASLQQAEDLAAAGQAPIQFIQNNTSPEALDAPTIYRNSKNLVALAEIKMGAN